MERTANVCAPATAVSHFGKGIVVPELILRSCLKERIGYNIKADKGNCIVLMDQAEYNRKVKDLLDSSKCTVAFIDSPFVFEAYVEQVPTAFHHSESLTENPLRLLNPNPKPLRFYGLPQLHKPNVLLRPVVSFAHL